MNMLIHKPLFKKVPPKEQNYDVDLMAYGLLFGAANLMILGAAQLLIFDHELVGVPALVLGVLCSIFTINKIFKLWR